MRAERRLLAELKLSRRLGNHHVTDPNRATISLDAQIHGERFPFGDSVHIICRRRAQMSLSVADRTCQRRQHVPFQRRRDVEAHMRGVRQRKQSARCGEVALLEQLLGNPERVDALP